MVPSPHIVDSVGAGVWAGEVLGSHAGVVEADAKAAGAYDAIFEAVQLYPITIAAHSLERAETRGGRTMSRMMAVYWTDEEGVTTMEYALLLVLICIGSLAAFSNLGSGVNDIWDKSVKAVLGR